MNNILMAFVILIMLTGCINSTSNSVPNSTSNTELIWLDISLTEYARLSEKDKIKYGPVVEFEALDKVMRSSDYDSLTEGEQNQIAREQFQAMSGGKSSVPTKKSYSKAEKKKIAQDHKNFMLKKMAKNAPQEASKVFIAIANEDDISKEIRRELLPYIMFDDKVELQEAKEFHKNDPKMLQEITEAVQNSNKSIDKIIAYIQDGYDVNSYLGSGRTLLYVSTSKGNFRLTKNLVENGAKINTLNPSNYSPVTVAAFFGQKEVANYLIDQGADLTIGIPFIKHAINFNDNTIIAKYLEQGGDIDAKDRNGMTALVRAVEKKGIKLNTIKYLVDNGADINIKLNAGYTLIKIAQTVGKKDVLNYLISKQLEE